jgi:radical SAM protein with 4Fe4S-binding SPASM domain
MIETNSQCNLKCTTCNREELKSMGLRENKTLTPKEFSETLEVFSDCNINTVKIEGISEPMLHPNFDQMCKIIRDKFPASYVIIATNCQYNLEKSPFLESLKYVDQVYLSIDGEKESYESIRVGATWDKLINFLESCSKYISTEVSKKKLYINFTATEENYKSLPAMYELSEKYNLAGVRINLAQNWNEDQENTYKVDTQMIEYLKQYAADMKGVPNWNYNDCFWPYEGAIIDVYGNIRQCIINTSQTPLFNIKDDGFKEFYNSSEHYKRVRSKLSKGEAPKECTHCDYKHLSNNLSEIMTDIEHKNTSRGFFNG